MVTDKKRTLPTESPWQQIVIDRFEDNDNKQAKYYKILPHRFLEKYDYSLFIDANTVFYGDIKELLTNLITGGLFTMFPYPMRSCLYAEACAIIGYNKAHYDIILKQTKMAYENSIPENSGLCEGSFIWRSHQDPSVISFMESWWNKICIGSLRDQISLAETMYQTNFYPSLIPSSVGTSRDNIYFAKAPHVSSFKTKLNPSLWFQSFNIYYFPTNKNNPSLPSWINTNMCINSFFKEYRENHQKK